VTAVRLACLLVPLFPLAARLRSEPELRREALVVVAGNGQAARVVAANRVARRAGLRSGMTLPQARALLPGLVARGRDPECERAAAEALLEVGERFSPRVEDGGEGLLYLEVCDAARHFPGADPERALGGALSHAAERAGLPAGVGIASSKLAARVAAGLPNSPTLVAPGREAAFLAPLPLQRLSPAVELAELLGRWGLRSIGDFARLPKDEVTSRLGPLGRELHAIARGLDPQPLVPRLPPPDFREGMELEWPLVALEPFLFVARATLDRLCQRLETRGLGCARLRLEMRLEPEGSSERAIALPAPTRDAKTLLTLVRLELEARPPGAAVAGFAFTAEPDAPRAGQLSLLGPAELSPDRLATTLARLFALLGTGRVGAPRPVDGHRPERAALVDYAPPPPPRVRPPASPGRGLLTVRVLRPPVALEVLTEGPPPQDGEAPHPERPSAARPSAARPSAARPSAVKTEAAALAARRPRIEGEVKVASGPWSLEESWWSAASEVAEGPTARDYWDVELQDGGVYRIFRTRPDGAWFADGVYD